MSWQGMSDRDPVHLPNNPAEELAVDCSLCDGTGEDGDSGEGFWEMAKCPHCDGTGIEPEEEFDPYSCDSMVDDL